MAFGDDFPDEETVKEQNYKEFKLDSIQEKNLKDIEKSLSEKKIHSDNKDSMLEYLEELYAKIADVKKEEHAYEGDSNFNVNRYLQRIKKLITEIEKI